MPVATRECFTVELRGMRAALAARAARDGLTESGVLRCALATALGTDPGVLPAPANDNTPAQRPAPHVKLSARLIRPAANRLDQSARAAGLSRGAYLARLIEGAPLVASSADRAALFRALNKSSEELAVMSRDINHLTQLLRQGSVHAAKSYAARHETLDRDVRSHLALAAAVLAELSAQRGPGGSRRSPP
ncbi:MAG: hypothetical protein ABJA61_07250 [Caldimonas sp.]